MRKSALLVFGLVVAAIVALGLVVLSSASAANGERMYTDAYFFMKRQFIYLAVGLVVAVATAAFDYHKWRDFPALTWVCYAVVLVLLCAVFAFKATKGSHRWIDLHFFRLQPSELAKLMTVIVVGVWMDRAAWRVELFKIGTLMPMVLIGVVAGLVMKEPDFGSTTVIGLVGMLVMFVAGARFWHMVPFFLMGAAVVAYKVLSNANRMARIAAWVGIKIEVAADVTDKAAQAAMWQGQMALAAIGNGGILGKGLNQSMQKHLYLPEAHTDMIFAIGAEEFGLPFSIATVLLFLLFFGFSIYIAAKADDRFGRFLVVGMAFIIFFQAMFNIGVVCEALPMKGMALPFFSYGGTNMLSAFFAVGTILSVGIHSYREKKREFARKAAERAS